MIKHFHELTDNEYEQLEAEGMTWDKLPDIHPQPSWCQYPGALDGLMGCWSLVYRLVKDENFCKDCEFYNPNPPSTAAHPCGVMGAARPRASRRLTTAAGGSLVATPSDPRINPRSGRQQPIDSGRQQQAGPGTAGGPATGTEATE